MKFLKRLVIMSGERAKGTLGLELNASGLLIRFNGYGSLSFPCDLIMRIDGHFCHKRLDDFKDSFIFSAANGKATTMSDVTEIHSAIFSDKKLVMYGTNQPKRLNNFEISAFIKHIPSGEKSLRAFNDLNESGLPSGNDENYEDIFSKAPFMDKTVKPDNLDTFEDLTNNEPDKLDVFKDLRRHEPNNLDAFENLKQHPNIHNDLDIYKNSNTHNKADRLDNYENLKNNFIVSEMRNAVYSDEQIAEENYYPESFMLSPQLAEVAVTKVITNENITNEIVTDEVSKSRKVEAAEQIVIKGEEKMTGNNDSTNFIKPSVSCKTSPSCMEQIFILANLAAAPKAEKAFAVSDKPTVESVTSANTEPKIESVSIVNSETKIEDITSIRSESKAEPLVPIRNKAKVEDIFAEVNATIKPKVESVTPINIEPKIEPVLAFNIEPKAEIASGQSTGASKEALRQFNATNQPKTTANSEQYGSLNKESEPIKRITPLSGSQHISARQSTFFEKNSAEIEKLFSGERERQLEEVLPSSRWAKISYDDSGRYYVIGIIGNQYLCYGVPATYSPEPPEELAGYSFWLPIDPTKPQQKGYWIMYQSLTSGKTVLPQ